jgi:hypothetical protein
MRRIVPAIFTVVIMTVAFISERYGADSTDAQDGPANSDAPVVMPANLAGILITFGIKETEVSVWAGEITTSAGKIVAMDISDGNAKKSTAKGAKFSLKSNLNKLHFLTNPESTLPVSLCVSTGSGFFAGGC